jgi:hypothetical protein
MRRRNKRSLLRRLAGMIGCDQQIDRRDYAQCKQRTNRKPTNNEPPFLRSIGPVCRWRDRHDVGVGDMVDSAAASARHLEARSSPHAHQLRAGFVEHRVSAVCCSNPALIADRASSPTALALAGDGLDRTGAMGHDWRRPSRGIIAERTGTSPNTITGREAVATMFGRLPSHRSPNT